MQRRIPVKKTAFLLSLPLITFAFWPAEAKPKPCKNCYCTVTATTVNFGAYDTLSGAAVNSAGNIEVNCGTDTIGDTISYAIELSGGKLGKPRELQGPDKLQYDLYTDVGRTSIWGNGKGGTAMVADSYSFPVLCCVTRNYTAYGRIAASQVVEPGVYSDIITVTVNF